MHSFPSYLHHCPNNIPIAATFLFFFEEANRFYAGLSQRERVTNNPLFFCVHLASTATERESLLTKTALINIAYDAF